MKAWIKELNSILSNAISSEKTTDKDFLLITRLLRTYGSRHRITDKGIKYYNDVIAKYLSGQILGLEPLMVIECLNAFTYQEEYDVDIGSQIHEELERKVGRAITDTSRQKIICYKKGYLEDNPDFDSTAESYLKLMLEKIEAKIQSER